MVRARLTGCRRGKGVGFGSEVASRGIGGGWEFYRL